MNRAQRRRLRHVSHGGRAYAIAEVVENGDGTYDLRGVEILEATGPIHGIGSPPEGDYWTIDELRGMAEADFELGEEMLPPNKIGHPDEQVLVRNSIKAGELPEPEDGEMPAVGWLENLRVDGRKLLADVRKVPKVVAELIEKGAYRTRSVELSKVTSQVNGKTYDWVVTGLAWLGGVQPAVKTLGDVAALYQGDVPIRRRKVIYQAYAAADLVWDPSTSFAAIRSDISEAINGPGPYMGPQRFWIRDVNPEAALVCEGYDDDDDAWVVAWSRASDGSVTVAPSSDWTRAEQGWFAAAKEYEAALTIRATSSDTGATMRYSAEQIRKFAEAIGRKVEEVTEKMLEDAGVSLESEEPETPEVETPEVETPPVADRELSERVAKIEARNLALETELHQEHRRTFVDAAIKAAKIAPGQRETLETLYDRDADAARKFVNELPVRDDLLDELGLDDDEGSRDLTENGRSYEDGAVTRLGIPKDKLI